MLCLSLKGQGSNSGWSLVRGRCEEAVWWGLGLRVPGLWGEGIRGADFGFTLLLLSSTRQSLPLAVPTGTQLETEGKGLGGVQSIQVSLLRPRTGRRVQRMCGSRWANELTDVTGFPMLWAEWRPSKILMLKS